MTVAEMVRDINRASECDKLVVFIGAGVSVNSGYRLWDSLIGVINSELGYSAKIDNFTTSEALLIPQYLFNTNKDRYYGVVLQEYGGVPPQTNAIIDSLLKLKPVHIVTTNFDLLIEKSLDENHVYGSTKRYRLYNCCRAVV